MFLKALQNKYNASVSKAKALKEVAGAEPTAEQMDAISAELENCNSIKAQIDQAKAMEDSFAGLDAIELDEGLSKTAKGIEVGKSAIEKDPMAGFDTQREFMMSVLDHGRSGNAIANDERLQFLAIDGDGQNTNNNPDGGFLIPKQMSNEILSTAAPVDPIGALTRKVPMGAPTVSINARVDKNHSTSVSGGLKVYRRDEEGEITKSKMQFEQVTLKANSLAGLAFASDEILTDSPQSIAAIIADGFDDEFVSKLVQERLYGTGAGEYEGITRSNSFLSVTRDTASQINIDDVLAMFARHWDIGGAMWIANKTTLPQIAKLQIATAAGVSGTPAFLPSVNQGMPATLMGLPIVFNEYAKALGTPNDLMLCNWSQYLEGSIGGISQAQSMHVRFSNMEQAFRFSTRNDGRSWWNSKLTPKHGDTLSPFVGLGAAS